MKTKPTQQEKKGGKKQGGIRWHGDGQGAVGGSTPSMGKPDGKVMNKGLPKSHDGEEGGTE